MVHVPAEVATLLAEHVQIQVRIGDLNKLIKNMVDWLQAYQGTYADAAYQEIGEMLETTYGEVDLVCVSQCMCVSTFSLVQAYDQREEVEQLLNDHSRQP